MLGELQHTLARLAAELTSLVSAALRPSRWLPPSIVLMLLAKPTNVSLKVSDTHYSHNRNSQNRQHNRAATATQCQGPVGRLMTKPTKVSLRVSGTHCTQQHQHTAAVKQSVFFSTGRSTHTKTPAVGQGHQQGNVYAGLLEPRMPHLRPLT